jgi:hypothetical protein
MSAEDIIKAEMRLFALESIVCQHLAMLYRSMPPEFFDSVKKQAIAGAQRQPFAGADAAHSDLFSAELEAALERLYAMIQHHLDTAQKRQQK